MKDQGQTFDPSHKLFGVIYKKMRLLDWITKAAWGGTMSTIYENVWERPVVGVVEEEELDTGCWVSLKTKRLYCNMLPPCLR